MLRAEFMQVFFSGSLFGLILLLRRRGTNPIVFLTFQNVLVKILDLHHPISHRAVFQL
jgi:hypothetical protein